MVRTEDSVQDADIAARGRPDPGADRPPAVQRAARDAAHDLRAPLTAIAGYTEQLIDSTGPSLPEEAQRAIAGMWHGIMRMRKIIEAVLDGPGAADGQVEVDCNLLVAEVLDLHSRQLAEVGASIHVGDLGSVEGDAHQLFRVFQNLIGNAIHHGEPADALELRVTAVDEAGERRFTVTDNGKGIPSHERRTLLSDRTGREDDRRGLGLSICKRIVEHGGGRIWIDSTPGTGTSVTFTVPVQARST